MNELLQNSLFFGVMLSFLTYEAGILLRKKFPYAFMNPLLISILVVILVLVVFHIDYETYNAGAKYLSYFLTPATVCLAVPLYDQFVMLKSHILAILSGIH